MKKGFIIRPEGTGDEVEFDNQTEYQTIKGAVGGWIERAPSNGDIEFWCNEEGKLQGLPFNRDATILWWSLGGPRSDVLVGSVFITGPADGSGACTGLDDEQLGHIKDYLDGDDGS